MFTESKITEIYCMADIFARNFRFNRKNKILKTRRPSIVISLIG